MSSSSSSSAEASVTSSTSSTTESSLPLSSPLSETSSWIPSHTRSWVGEKRQRYSEYAREHETGSETGSLPCPVADQQAKQHSTSAQANTLSETLSHHRQILPHTHSIWYHGGTAAAGIGLSSNRSSGGGSHSSSFVVFESDHPSSSSAAAKRIKLPGSRVGDGGEKKKNSAYAQQVLFTPFGTVWSIDNEGNMVKQTQEKTTLTQYNDPAMLPSSNNSRIFDFNTSQRLSQEEVEKLKADKSISPEELVKLLAQNSATYESKTEYSQEKYLKKKRAKHCPEVLILPPNLLRVAAHYFENEPKKIRFLRPDSLAQILALANVSAHTSTLVVDHTQGLMLGSCLYRNKGMGYVINAMEKNNKKFEIVRRFGFSPSILKAMLHVPLIDLVEGKAILSEEEEKKQLTHVKNFIPPPVDTKDSANKMNDTETVTSSSTDSSSTSTSTSSSSSPSSSSSSSSSSSATTAELSPSALLRQGVDSIILVSRYDPIDLLPRLLPYLAPCGRFVVYDESPQVLGQLAATLSPQEYINVTLSESWFRPIQVLPNRTHPFVNMSGGSGFILSGIKIAGGYAVQKN